MDLNRYKIFLSVADSGSFTAAAAAWNYTPSGVVHLINALEQEFGFPLFVRTRRGVHLTTDGEQLVAPTRLRAAAATRWMPATTTSPRPR